MEPGATAGTRGHCDQYFFEANFSHWFEGDPNDSKPGEELGLHRFNPLLTAWLPLSQIDADTGLLQVVPGSHTWPAWNERKRHMRTKEDDKSGDEEENEGDEREQNVAEFVDPPAELVDGLHWHAPDTTKIKLAPGDLILFDTRVFHRGTGNTTQGDARRVRLSCDARVRLVPSSSEPRQLTSAESAIDAIIESVQDAPSKYLRLHADNTLFLTAIASKLAAESNSTVRNAVAKLEEALGKNPHWSGKEVKDALADSYVHQITQQALLSKSTGQPQLAFKDDTSVNVQAKQNYEEVMRLTKRLERLLKEKEFMVRVSVIALKPFT